MAELRIATFVNDEGQYRQLSESFRAAGFVEPRVVYERLSDETTEPFSEITRLGRSSEPHVVLVHQDVRCDQGHAFADLERALQELTELDSRWAVAGNAGGLDDRGLVRHLSDPHGTTWAENLPRRVVTLDENFLVLRTARAPSCSQAMDGFHLYGADVCLRSAQSGSTAYAIDFRLSHLSAGKTRDLPAATERFAELWSREHLLPRYLRTPNGVVALARPRLLRSALQHPTIRLRLGAEPGAE